MARNTSIFMTYGDVKGDAADAAHKNWIQLDECKFSIHRNVTQESGNPKRNVGTPSLSIITLTKWTPPHQEFFYNHSQAQGKIASFIFVAARMDLNCKSLWNTN